jgi:hypothetical protein
VSPSLAGKFEIRDEIANPTLSRYEWKGASVPGNESHFFLSTEDEGVLK